MTFRDKTLIILFIIAMLISSCAPAIVLPPGPGPGDFTGGTMIITVDGLSVINSLGTFEASEEPQTSYLYTSLKNKITDAKTEIIPFSWSGDASKDTAVLLNNEQNESNLRYFLRQKYNQAKSESKKMVVIGHSWGSVLTYYALALEGAESDPLEPYIYLSLSSPLGSEYTNVINYPEEIIISQYVDTALKPLNLTDRTGLYPRAKWFYNYWAWGDVVSGPLSALITAQGGPYKNFEDVRIDRNIFILPEGLIDILGAYENRDISNCTFWHKMTSLDDTAADDTTYTIKKDISNARELYNNFVKGILNIITP